MEYNIERISGNAYHITLKPSTPFEKELLDENLDRQLIEAHYRIAIRSKFGERARPGSLTPGDKFPFEAIVEVFTESGSV
jgi:hypothetical protein